MISMKNSIKRVKLYILGGDDTKALVIGYGVAITDLNYERE